MIIVDFFLTKSFIPTTILLFWSVTINAQSDDTSRIILEEGWIEDMGNRIGFDISLNNAFEIFHLKAPGTEFNIHPNIENNIRLGVNYRFISAGIEFAPDFLPGNGDRNSKGKTQSFEIGSSLILRHWFADLEYASVRGYFLENTRDFVAWKEGDPYIQFPDLSYQGVSINSGYIMNSKYSLNSVISQTERQLKSAGTFMPFLSMRYYLIDDQSSDVNTQKTDNTEIRLGPGYAHTLVVREKFYASFGAFTGIGYQNTMLTSRLFSGNVQTRQDNFLFTWRAQSGIGINGRRFYSGLYAEVSGKNYRQENTTVMNRETRILYHFFLGYRIKPIPFIQKQVEKIESIMN